MHPFWKPNITAAGRIARLLSGCLLAVAGWFAWEKPALLSIGLHVAALFCWFEAARGWCIARACGIKTPC